MSRQSETIQNGVAKGTLVSSLIGISLPSWNLSSPLFLPFGTKIQNIQPSQIVNAIFCIYDDSGVLHINKSGIEVSIEKILTLSELIPNLVLRSSFSSNYTRTDIGRGDLYLGLIF